MLLPLISVAVICVSILPTVDGQHTEAGWQGGPGFLLARVVAFSLTHNTHSTAAEAGWQGGA